MGRLTIFHFTAPPTGGMKLMTRLNFSSFFVYFFYLLFSLSFFRTSFEDFCILLISGTIALLAFLALGVNFLDKKEKVQLNLIVVLISLWLVNVGLPIVFNIVQPTAQYGLFQCCAWISAFFLIASNNGLVKNWQQFKKLIYLLGFIFSLWAIIQHYAYDYMATGPFATRNSNGAFLMLTALIICSEFLTSKKPLENTSASAPRKPSLFYSVLFFLINLAILLSFSRGVYLSYGLSLLFLFMFNINRAGVKSVLLLSALILLSLIFLRFSAWEAIQHRLDILAQEQSRMIIWKGAWHLWQNSPWYGIGIENFKYFYPAFSLPGDGSTLENAHNDYLQLLVETGISGVTVLFSLILSFFYYCIQYLRNPRASSSSHIAITTQIAALASLALYAFVDFSFYIFPFNIMLGVLLGFLYQNLNSQGYIGHITPRIKSSFKKALTIPLALLFLFITSLFLNLLHYTYNSERASEYINQGQLPAATKAYNDAQQYLDSPYVYNNLASLYLERAKKTNNESTRFKLIAKAEEVIAQTITRHPYSAEPYFQRGLIYALYYNDVAKAQAAFERFIQLKPHANFERLTFCYFLLEQDQLLHAQDLLEQGLLYPIDPYYSPKYLELLANLRLKNGDNIGAQQIADAIEHIETYRLDFSALASSKTAHA